MGNVWLMILCKMSFVAFASWSARGWWSGASPPPKFPMIGSPICSMRGRIGQGLSPWLGAVLIVCAEDSIGQKMAARTNIYLIWYTKYLCAPHQQIYLIFPVKGIPYHEVQPQ
jgi:hypothetical protein